MMTMPSSLECNVRTCAREVHQYVPHSSSPEAHTLETWISPAASTSGYWIIYIHGGAWWRPMITSSAFSLTVQDLLSQPNSQNIAGFASLNYRLSRPPPLPQFAEFTQPDNPARNVKHPSHLEDVIAGLAFLQYKYGFASNYVLVGHSCGATLAFQMPLGAGVIPPTAVVGVEGIYDLPKLVEDYSHAPIYRHFIESAFGKDGKSWESVSPTTQQGERAWMSAKVVALVQSDEDELVGPAQRDVMWETVQKTSSAGRRDLKITVTGKHDQIWKESGPDGTQLACAINTVIESLLVS